MNHSIAPARPGDDSQHAEARRAEDAPAALESAKKRILFVSYTAERTGPVNSLLLLLDGLGGDFEASVLLPGDGPLRTELERRGIPAFSFPSLTKRYLPGITRLLWKGKFDVVYANTSDGTSRLLFAASVVSGASFVCHVRALEWRKSWLELGHLRFADAVIAVSRACAASVERFVRPGRLHVVYNGVRAPGDAPSGDSRLLRAELGLEKGENVLLGVAHLCSRKGQEHAIAALARVADEAAGAHLCLAGALDRDPGYVERQRRAIRAAGLEARVHVLGFRTDVEVLMRSADVFVHTALADPHPRAVLEAMALGLPVVAFAVDGVAETIVDGETGRLVPPGDADALAAAIVELLEDRPRRVAMGRAARERVLTRFTDDAAAGGVKTVLQDVGRGG